MSGLRVSALAAAALLWTTPVLSGTAETLEKECKAQLGLSDSACKCIGQKAEAELNDTQQALVVAVITEDDASMTELQAQMSQAEAVQAGEFMTSAPGACANQ